MQLVQCKLEGLILIKPKKLADNRGFFCEVFRKNLLEESINEKITFCQSNLSKSFYGTIRGLHYQTHPFSQSKLVSAVEGEILDVVLDIRKKSKTYGKIFSVILNDKNNYRLFIPKGFAHGFSVLSETATILYDVDNYYNSESERGINPLDTELAIDWKIKHNKHIISAKDQSLPNFNSIDF